MRSLSDHYLARIREHELRQVLPWLPPGSSIVELGGGSGLQAAALQAAGYRVRSFDIAPAAGSDVGLFDGVHLPLTDAWADVVYSSNTLEHVVHLEALLADCARVLKPGGLAVHVLPTPTWRLLSLVGHYPFGLRALVRSWARSESESASTHRMVEPISAQSRRRGLQRLVPPAHGEFASAVHELWEYSAPRWRARFARAGYRVVAERPLGLAYAGYGLLPHLPMSVRRHLATVIGSACRVYVLGRADV